MGAAAILVAGCGSDAGSAATTSAATTSTSSSMASSTSSATEKSTVISPSVTATTTVGGGATSLDAQSTAWFETLCTGVAPLADLPAKMSSVSSGQELGTAMTTVGTAFTDTAGKLADQPPPTFEGGQDLAANTQTAMQSFGQTFQDFAARASQLQDGDSAGQQKFLSDFQAAMSQSPIAKMELTPDVQESVKQIPACRALMSSS